MSTHVDDLKGAGEDKYRDQLLQDLENRFGKLKTKYRSFGCIAVMHHQDPSTKEILALQKHYVPQINAISVDSKI